MRLPREDGENIYIQFFDLNISRSTQGYTSETMQEISGKCPSILWGGGWKEVVGGGGCVKRNWWSFSFERKRLVILFRMERIYSECQEGVRYDVPRSQSQTPQTRARQLQPGIWAGTDLNEALMTVDAIHQVGRPTGMRQYTLLRERQAHLSYVRFTEKRMCCGPSRKEQIRQLHRQLSITRG